MPCDAERVTAFVDRELPAGARAGMEPHLRICPTCGAQAGFETELRERLLTLAPLRLPPALAPRILRAVRTDVALSAGASS